MISWFKSTKFKLTATYSLSLLAVLLASGLVLLYDAGAQESILKSNL